MSWLENPPAVVILARQFNLSILTRKWLSKNGLMPDDEDAVEGFLFSEQLVQVTTPEFALVVLPEQLQFIIREKANDPEKMVREILGQLITKLPHTPYKAIGVNFNWHFVPEEGGTESVTRTMFFSAEKPIFQRFDDPTARFGTYMSRDFNTFRLKMNIHPIRVETEPGVGEDRIFFGFNFHQDVPTGEERVAELLVDGLGKWADLRQEAMETIRLLGWEKLP